MLVPKRRNSRLYRRLRIFAILAVIVAAYFGWQAANERLLPRYRNWKQHKALARAKEFIAKKDPESAKLEIEIALVAVPGSLDAIRTAADLFELVGSSQALALRRQVVDRAPDSVPDRLALANVALRFHDYNAARDALAGFTPAQVEQPAVLRAHLAYALATHNRPVADALFDRLAGVAAPDDEMRALHAILLLRHPNPKIAARAKRELETLAQNPKFTLTLNREFFTEAIATKDFPAAKRYAALVVADPAATFADHINQGSLQLLVDKQPFDLVFSQLAPLAAANGPDAAEFIRWLIVQGKVVDAAHWLAGLSPAILGSPAVVNAQVELAIADKDWEHFGRLVEGGAWGKVSPEVIRLALAAHVVGTRNPGLRRQVWDEAVAAAGGNPVAFRVLLRVAGTWQWEDEAESLLWTVIRADPSQAWAHSALLNAFRERGDGAKMLEVMTILAESAPTSRTYRHDWALLSLLVSPHPTWDAAKAAAKDVYLAEPTNPNYATTYALALTQAGQAEAGREVLEKLSPSEREFPLRAPYFAYVYGFCRRRADFEKYAALADRPHLLREERLLIDAGRDALTSGRGSARPKPYAPKKAAFTGER